MHGDNSHKETKKGRAKIPELRSNNIPQYSKHSQTKRVVVGRTASESRSFLRDMKNTIPVLVSDMKKVLRKNPPSSSTSSKIPSRRNNRIREKAGKSLSLLEDMKQTLPILLSDMKKSLKQVKPSEVDKEELDTDLTNYLSEGDFAIADQDSESLKNTEALVQERQSSQDFQNSITATTRAKAAPSRQTFKRTSELADASNTIAPQPATQTTKHTRTRSSRKRSKPISDNTFYKKLMVYTGVAMLAFLLWGFTKMTFSSDKTDGDTPTALAASTSPATIAETAINNLDKTYAVAEEFLKSRTIEDILVHSRQTKRIAPLLHKYYEDKDIDYSDLKLNSEKYDIANFGDNTATLLEAVSSDGTTYPLCVTNSLESGPKVDWESFVNYSETEWSELKALRPIDPVLMRGKLKKAYYFNFKYTEDLYTCYRLSSFDNQHFVYVYTKRDGRTQESIEEQMSMSPETKEKFTSAIVRIFFERDAGTHQAKLDSLVNFGIVYR